MYKGFSIFLLLSCKLATALEFDPLSDAYIDYINKQGKWIAGRNFHPDTPMSDIVRLLCAEKDGLAFAHLPRIEHDPEFIKSLPESCDLREKWPNCPSIKEIQNQGACGSCWAFGAVEAMTDRICTYSNGSQNFHFSVEDLLTCSGAGDCENGGYPASAWKFWVDEGLVSGGNYGSHEGCKSYSYPPGLYHNKINLPTHVGAISTPPCVKQCQKGYKVPYEQDKRKGKSTYAIKGEENIKAEIFKHGPVEASFAVYSDFLNYKGHVYFRTNDDWKGYHAVKIIGWGVEDGMKYWLCANSWGTTFGLEGFFKIRRGVDECEIEESIVAGEPEI